MRRSGVVGLAVVGLMGAIGIVGSAAAAATSGGVGLAPDKTLPPTTSAAPGAGAPSSVPVLGPTTVPPTAAPPTSAWIVTTAPPTAATVAVPTTSPAASPSTATASVTSFDGLGWLTEIYAALAEDPFTLLDIAERTTVINTAADVWIAHLLGVTITEQMDMGVPLPAYTVTEEGKAVRVCSDATKCDVYSDFFAPTGLLETFSVNGVPLAAGVGFRRVNVESLSVDTTLCLSLSDGALSCVLLLSSEGASTALSWDQAMFTAPDGRQIPPDLTRSGFTPSIADGGFGSGHLIFPGAPTEGEITLPIVSGLSGIPNVVTIQLRAL